MRGNPQLQPGCLQHRAGLRNRTGGAPHSVRTRSCTENSSCLIPAPSCLCEPGRHLLRCSSLPAGNTGLRRCWRVVETGHHPTGRTRACLPLQCRPGHYTRVGPGKPSRRISRATGRECVGDWSGAAVKRAGKGILGAALTKLSAGK